MNPLSLIPNKVRAALYLIYGIGAAVLIYTETKGLTGDAEMTLWLALGAVVNVTAASNVSTGPTVNAVQSPVVEEYVGDHRAPLEG